MKQFSFNKSTLSKLSIILVYIAMALLAISDSGIQLLILMEIGPGSRTLRLIAMWLLFAKCTGGNHQTAAVSAGKGLFTGMVLIVALFVLFSLIFTIHNGNPRSFYCCMGLL